MTKIGIALPGKDIDSAIRMSSQVANYNFDSFSVYGDLGDIPPYAVLHACAHNLKESNVNSIGPMGIPVGLMHPEVIASHSLALKQQLSGQAYIGLVRGAFLEEIDEKPASLEKLESTIGYIRTRFAEKRQRAPIYLGGYGRKLLELAGSLEVDGVKIGGSVNVDLAREARRQINNPNVKIVMGAVSVIAGNRKLARNVARISVSKYLNVVGRLDNTLNLDEEESLSAFMIRYAEGCKGAHHKISDGLLDKFTLAGTPDDALEKLAEMEGVVDRFEFGTPHGLGDNVSSIDLIGQSIINELRG